MKEQIDAEQCTPDARYERGLAALKAVSGSGYEAVLEALEETSPDFIELLVAGAYGDVMARPGLALKARELINVAAIAALGKAPSALRFHLGGMLETGWSPREVIETLVHVLPYAGVPAAQDAIGQARTVFEQRGVRNAPVSERPADDDWQLGVRQMVLVGDADGLSIARRVLDEKSLTADLDRLVVEFVHGEIWSRPGLSMKDRALATLAMVIAVGNLDDDVRNHVRTCLRTGWTRAELVELLMQMPTYVGWPQALTALGPAHEAFATAARDEPAQVSDLVAARSQARTDDARYQAGVHAMARISQASGEAVVASFADIAPDVGRYIMELSYGDVFARPGLDLKTRELATIAALTASGRNADATPFDVHVNAALNVGATEAEVFEAILHVVPYAGFSRALRSAAAARKIVEERRSR